MLVCGCCGAADHDAGHSLQPWAVCFGCHACHSAAENDLAAAEMVWALMGRHTGVRLLPGASFLSSKRLAQIGRGIVRRQGSDVALMGYGTAVNECLAAAEILAKSGIKATVADMRYAVPASLPGLWGAV